LGTQNRIWLGLLKVEGKNYQSMACLPLLRLGMSVRFAVETDGVAVQKAAEKVELGHCFHG